MRKLIQSSLLACSLVFVSCEQTTNETASVAPTLESATQLRENNIALVKNLQALQGQIEARTAARVAARSAATPNEGVPEMPEMPVVDFGVMKTQIRASLQASGACQPWIDFVVDLFGLLEKMMNADPTTSSEADAVAFEEDITALFSKALSCLEPLLKDVNGAEDPNMGALMGNVQAFDKCICGSAGGSIFGTSAALVYSNYGPPSTGTAYEKPAPAGGESYSAPGSPAGSGYGAPALFPK
jgi:hypothetical protein